MPSVDLVLKLRLRILSEEDRSHDFISRSLAHFDFETKFSWISSEYSEQRVACQSLFLMTRSNLTSMELKPTY